MDEDIKEKTARVAKLYFDDFPDERPFDLWRAFDKGLARELSLFITGKTVWEGTHPARDSPVDYSSCIDSAGQDRRTETACLRRFERRRQSPASG